MAFLPNTQKESPRQLLHPEFALSHDQFAFRLLKTVVAQDPVRNNKLISPLSLYLTLGILYNGAAHETKDSLAGALRAEDIEIPNFNSFCKEALQQMPLEDDHVDFTITNAIWYNRRRLTLQPAYEELVQNFYYTPVQPLNFSARDAATHINQWINENTRHEIDNVVGKLNANDAMVVVNALYFKAPWVKPFEANDTKPGEFHLLDLPARTVRYMNQKGVLNTFSDTSFTMVELPCGLGRNYSLYVLQPDNADKSVENWITDLNPEKLNHALDLMTPQFLDFYLPRWESNYAISDERTVLSRLGLSSTVTPWGEPDFSNMYTPGTHKAFVSQIFHQTRIRVDEDGMVASAGSGAQLTSGTSTGRSNMRVVRFDRPFVYFLMEKQRNLILMTGIVNDPTLTAQPPAPPVKKPTHHRLWRKHRAR